jgi:hypothetical protein
MTTYRQILNQWLRRRQKPGARKRKPLGHDKDMIQEMLTAMVEG